MKTKSNHLTRPAMLSEYLRYMWSRPVPVRIKVNSSALPSPSYVPGARIELTKQRGVLDQSLSPGLSERAQLGKSIGRGFLSFVIALLLVIIGAKPALAQANGCPETNVVKFVQPPRTDGGFDLWDTGPWALADDFICTNTGPITDIHLWGSWLNDAIDPNATFWLGIYDDIPAITNGPVIVPSRPGTNLLWQQYFGPGQYSQSQVAAGLGNFYNPEPPAIMGNDSKVLYYCFYPTNPPVQTGTPSNPRIYWLAVYAKPLDTAGLQFGWKSANFRQFDISTHTPWPGGAPVTTDWRPNYGPNNLDLDLAFKINTATNPPSLCCPETNGVKFIQRPHVPGGIDINASQNLVLADDFQCTNTGPVTDIHLWGSWLNDYTGHPNVDPNVVFTLSIWSDVPKQTNGGVVLPSHPGTVLWSEPFGPGEYYQCLYTNVAEGFFDPSIPGDLGVDGNVYYLCFYPKQPFIQQGTVAAHTNYWLSVNAQTTAGSQRLFGWHNSIDFYNDVAVWGAAPFPAAWNTMKDEQGNPVSLAFKVTTPTNTPPPAPCCPETNGVKFVQYPQIPGGLDVNASRNPAGQNLALADDFICTNTGPVTDIHLWGSWLQDNVDTNAHFILSIWSDVPKQTNATGVLPSHPGVVLWTEPFGPGEYYQCLYSNVTEQFYDPSIPNIIGGDSKVYYLCFYPKSPFIQRGTAAVPTNYWLSVSAQTAAGSQQLFGWHTSYQHYNDIAVWGNTPFPASWNTLFDLQGNPLSLAFKVTTPTNTPCPPGTIICPPNKTVECGTTWSFDDPRATNACCGTNITLTVLNTTTNGTCPMNITRVWQVTDCSGFTANCSQTVTVVDTTPPVFALCPTNRTVECSSQWQFDTPIAQDNCCLQGIFAYGTFTNNANCPLVVTRLWVASDCCGNTNTCSQTITVVDTTPPVFTFCPTNRTIECGTPWEFGTPAAIDNCCLQGVAILNTITNGLCPQFITRTWLARDCCGNTNTCSQTIIVVDTTPPVFTFCPTNRTVECGSSWAFDTPVATDNCCLQGITVFGTFTNGVCPQTITRVWVAKDCCGNTNTCSQIITVVDTTPPTLTCSPDKTVQCGTPWMFDPPTATDNCCSNLTVSVISTITNGSPCDYVISRTWIALDCCQNRSIPCTQTVRVVDTLSPTVHCPTNMIVNTCGTNATVTWIVTATDNCSTNIIVTSTPPSGTTFTRGTTNAVHVTASDGCGNTNTCDFTITVQRPVLNIVLNGSLHTVTLTWDDGILQGADEVLGPYIDIPLATSPYTVSATGPYRFYRLRCP